MLGSSSMTANGGSRVIVYDLRLHSLPMMDSHYDLECEAEAAMKLAVAAYGLERQRWIRLA
jgi:hypothetical protein